MKNLIVVMALLLAGCGWNGEKPEEIITHECTVADGHVITFVDKEGDKHRAISSKGVYWEIAASSRTLHSEPVIWKRSTTLYWDPK